MNCPKCGMAVTPGTQFCPNCGENVAACTPPQSNGASAFCPNCGAPVASDAAACGNCGMPLGGSAAQSSYTSPSSYAQPQNPPVQRSRLIAAFLALFFGVFALEDFYLGEKSMGVVHLIVSIITWGIGGAIWGFVNAIRLLTHSINYDANGIALKDFNF